MERLGIVIAAAGTGSRMQASVSKQFLQLLDKPVIAHTIELFERMQEVSEIVVVTGGSDIERMRSYCNTYNWRKIKAVVPGGADRQESVHQGLKAISRELEWVMIHDGVRPLITQEAVLRCLDGARRTGAAVLAVPVKDTIKQVNEAGEIVTTPDRTSLRAVQTPQAFRRSLILEAHRQAEKENWKGTDDASLAEHMGLTVIAVEGEYRNLKLTTPEDMIIAERLLKKDTFAGE